MMSGRISPHRASRRFVGDRSGSSVVEFALLLPLMMTMYFGSIQVTDAISADRQVTLVSEHRGRDHVAIQSASPPPTSPIS